MKLATSFTTVAVHVASPEAADEFYDFADIEERWRGGIAVLELRTRGAAGHVVCGTASALVGGVDRTGHRGPEEQAVVRRYRAGDA